MTKKFDFKSFKGNLIWLPIPGQRGIRRRQTWNELKRQYEDPINGPLYEARRIAVTGGNRISRTFSSLQKAREWKERRNTNDCIEQDVSPEGGYLFKQLVADFKARRFPFLTEGTVIYYERLFQSFADLEGLVVDQIMPKDIANWMKRLTSPELMSLRRQTRLSFEKELDALSMILHWYIEEFDAARLVFPIKKKHYCNAVVRRKPKRKVVLSDQELERWLTILKREHPLFYAIAFVQTSQLLRISEVCAMKWSHLDLENGKYEICEHVFWPRIQGRSAKLVSGTKTNSESYWIPLWLEVQELLKDMMKTAQADLIFSTDGNLLSYRKIQYAYNCAFELAGLPHRSTHVCRHTGSTIFLDRTNDLQALQQLGGWKNQKMPQHYAKIRSQRAEQAMRKAEKLELVKEDHACS